MTRLSAPQPHLRGKHYRRRPLTGWAIGVIVALVSGLLSLLPILAPTPAYAAISWVQSTGTTWTGSGGSTMVKAFGSNNTAGNMIVAAATWDHGGSATCTDTNNNVYTMVINWVGNDTSNLAICYAVNIAGGANTVTMTLANSEAYTGMAIAEYSGVATVNPVDAIMTNLATATTATDAVTSGSATTTSDGDLILGVIDDTTSDHAVTAGTGFTARAGVTSWPLAFEDKIQTSAGSVAATWTYPNTNNYNAAMIAFRPANTPPRAPIVNNGDGIMVHGTAHPAGPGHASMRTYDSFSNTFSTAKTTGMGSSTNNALVRTSPFKREAIAAFADEEGNAWVACFDGTSWTQGFKFAPLTAPNYLQYDIAYETNSGDVVVMYSTGGTTNELAYRTKSGSSNCSATNWSSATTVSAAQTTGVIRYVKMSSDKRPSSDLIAVAWADANSDLSTMIWSGSGWTNEPSAALENALQVGTSAHDVDDFDLDWEASGDLMVVWGRSVAAGVAGAYYATCTGGTSSCSWGASHPSPTVTVMPTFADDATSLDLSANPTNDEMVFASIGKGQSDLQIGYWSGSAWTNTANVDTSAATPVAGTRLVATGWLVSGNVSRSVIVYNDGAATNVGFYTGNGSTFTVQTDFTPSGSFSNPQKWYDIQVDPINRDRMMFTTSDNTNDLYAKRAVMTSAGTVTFSNSDEGRVESWLPQAITSPGSFAYWQNVSQSETTQSAYIFENDDGTADTNTQLAAGNTAITGVKKGSRVTARVQLTNTGAPLTGDLALFYDRNDGVWTKVRNSTAPVTGNGSCNNTIFDCEAIVSTNDVGGSNALAYDQAGTPWIAYYDTTGGDLKIAHYIGSGGSGCASSAWTCITVDNTNDTGRRLSMAIDNNGSPWIAYWDFTAKSFKVANFVGGGGGIGCSNTDWSCNTVDSTVASTGQTPSIAVSKSGVIWTTYYQATNTELRVARYMPGGGGTGCSVTSWSCSSIDTTGTVGQTPSIAFDGQDRPWVSYYDATNGYLKVAQYVVGAGSGCAVTTWTCTSVDINNSGSNSTIAFDPSGKPWVAYYDTGNTGLSVARYVGGTGGSGCNSSAWTCTSVDTANDVGNTNSSIAFDPAGRAWVTYYDGTSGDLKYTRYVSSGGSGCASSAWTCDTIDTSNVVGSYSSMAFDSSGRLTVSYYDTTNGDLRYASTHRAGEITLSAGLAGTNGDVLAESHTDMSSTADTTGRDDIDCATGGAYFNNGKWYNAENGRNVMLPSGTKTTQCTEIAFTLDTSQATAGTTYRFVVASKDSERTERSLWRGMNTISSYPTLTIESSTTTRVSKDAMLGLSNCSVDTTWGCVTVQTGMDEVRGMAFDQRGNHWISMADSSNRLVVGQLVGTGGTGCTSAVWNCTIVDTATSMYDSKMAMSPSGSPWIEYQKNDNMWIAIYVGSNGTGCASSSAWTCYAVDTTASVGGYGVDIGFDPTGAAWITYYNGALGTSKVAHFVGTGGTGCATVTWSCTTVYSTAYTGLHSSLAFDQSGRPWYSTKHDNDLIVMKYVGVGGSGCASTAWTCEVVVSGSSGQFSGLAFDASGTAWISWYHNSNLDMQVAKYVGSGGSNCTSSAWTCTAVDSTGDVGLESSIAIDSAGNPWIAYEDSTNDTLKVARFVGSGGSNCASSAWTCGAIDAVGNANGIAPVLAFDRSGTPWISYLDNLRADLSVAKMHLPPTQPSYSSVSNGPLRNAKQGDARYRLDTLGYSSVSTANSVYDSITTTAAHTPIYVAAKQTATPTGLPSMTWTGQSTVAFTTRAATVQIWNNTTKAWATPGSVSNGCSATAANTNCTITASAAGMASDFYETDGSNYWAYFRVYQAVGSVETLRTDLFSISTSATGTRAELTQRGSILENDDGAVDTNTQLAAGNTSVSNMAKGARATVRVQLDNAAATNAANLGLFYDRNDGIWSQVGQANTPVTGSGSCTDTNFDCTTIAGVTATGSWGADTSMAIDPSGTPWISYYDDNGDDLYVARYVGSGGSGCTSSAWTCVAVQTTNAVGLHSSIAFSPTGVPWISYYDNTGNDLRIAQFVGSGGTGCATTSWTCTSVDSTNDVGTYTSIAFSSSGVPWISYAVETGPYLRVAQYVGSGGTGCATAVWTCTTLDSGVSIGYETSLAFDSSGNPWVSYQDHSGTSLKVAKYVGSGGTGCSTATWTCTIVHAVDATYTSIAFDSSGNPWISYADDSGADLWVARYVGAGGAGCTNSAWTCTNVDSTDFTGYETSLAFDPSGRAWVSYYSSTSGALRLARYVGSGGSGCTSSAWTCTTVEGSGDAGWYTSLAFGPDGTAWISYLANTSDVLRVAKLRRSGELFIASGLAGASGDALSESHVDMSSTGDTTNRDDADCVASTATWNNGKWFESIEGSGVSLPSGAFYSQCTEVSFVIDTSQATPGTTYRFVVASKDNWRADKTTWRGPASVVNYPTLSIEANTTLRVAKDSMPGPATCSNAAWSCTAVDTARDVWWDRTSMAVDNAGTPWVAYEEDTGKDIWVAKYVGSGGSGCASSAWTCVEIQNASTMVLPTIKIDPSGTPWVTYWDDSNDQVEVAKYVGSGGSGCASSAWTCTDVGSGYLQYHGSMTFDAIGNPWIFYEGATNYLNQARYVGSGGTGCLSSAWTGCTAIITASTEASYVSATSGPNGDPWISFNDQVGDDVWTVHYVGSGGTGCATTAWTCYNVDSTNDLHESTAIAVDSSGNPWVSYRYTSSADLRVARYVGSGGTGCGISSWTCTNVMTSSDVGWDSSIAFDSAGAAWVSYTNSSAGSLMLAQYVGSGGTGCAVTSWTCSTIDTTRGNTTSLAFDRSGVPWIAYQDGTNKDLWVATLSFGQTPLSYNSRYVNPDRNSMDGDARYRLDVAGKSALTTDDTTYDTVTAAANEAPFYTLAVRAGSNSSFPSYEWMGQSSVSTATRNAKIEVYRYGSTNAWVTLDTESTAGASTQFTLTGTASAGSASEYWEADGGNYWASFRVRQAAHGSAETLTSDYFGAIAGSNTAPNFPSSLAQKTTGDVVIATGNWRNSTSVKFTATVSDTDNPDTLQLCIEAKALGVAFTNTEDSCGTGAAYAGSGVTASHTLTLSDATEYHWQARVKDAGGLYSTWVSYDVNLESARDIGIDTTAPTGGSVYDGTVNGIDSGYNTGSLTTLSANWASVSSNVSGLAGYEYSIGTTAGATNIKSWTSTSTTPSMTDSSLTLQTSVIYYVNVRTTDAAGNTSTLISSDGQMVAPTLTLTLSTNALTFADLTVATSYTDVETLDATVATNAYNGYQLTQYATGLLTYDSSTISMYAGPWADPTTWTGTGLGYTSSDTSVSGSNRFVGATEYAGVKNGGPGDVVADSSVSAAAGQLYTLTYRLTVASSQPAGRYANTLVITAVASY